jgi:hypothetical protein
MNHEGGPQPLLPVPAPVNGDAGMPAAWREFIRFCQELRHGEIEHLSIQDGLPVLAEITKKKVKFTRNR